MHADRGIIKTMFQQMRSALRGEAMQGYNEQIVLRTSPCLFLLHAFVITLDDTMPRRGIVRSHDAFARQRLGRRLRQTRFVHHDLRMESVFTPVPGQAAVTKEF